jgi:sterol desaturase/sphingolipid hydroxylase (fatty acid hydroxylase superfamily)
MVSLISPGLFPFINFFKIATFDEKKEVKPPVAKPYADFYDHISVEFATIPKLLISILSWHYLAQSNIISQASTFSWDWMSRIIYRDLLITILGGFSWEFLVSKYSPVQHIMKKSKFNPEYPAFDHILFCAFWCLVSTVISSLQEIYYLHLLATNQWGWDRDIYSTATIIGILTMPYLRIVHFFAIHRFMHNWNVKIFGVDPGKIIYTYVHQLHHLSYNPTALSGISMSPIESFLYFSVAFLPGYLWSAHPLIFLLYKIDCNLAAIWGHDGHGDPGAASYPHYLHHKLYNVNYGENYVPLDWAFGSFFSGERELKKKE